MKITDYKEWEIVVSKLKQINDSVGLQLLNTDATPDNLGKIGELQGTMKTIYRVINLPNEIWPSEDKNEGDED